MAANGTAYTIAVRADVTNINQALVQLEQRLNSVGANATRALNIQLNVRANQTQQQLQQARQEIETFRQNLQNQGIDVPIRINVREAERDLLNFRNIAEGSLRGLFRGVGAGGGVPVGLGFGAGAAATVAAGQAVEALSRATIQGVESGIKYNSMLEQANLQLVRYTGSAQGAAKVLEQLTHYADVTPFGTEETIKTGTDLLRVTDGNIDRMQELLKLSGALAVTNPYQGLEGASYAIRELLSGDVQSFADRFNTSRTLLQQLRAEAKSDDELIKLAVAAAGGSTDLINKMSQTFEGRLSTIQSFIAQIGAGLTSGLFNALSEQLGEATKALDEHSKEWRETAQGIGFASAAVAKFIADSSGFSAAIKLMAGGLGLLATPLAAFGRLQESRQAQQEEAVVPIQQRPEYQSNAAAIKADRDELNKQKSALIDVNATLKQNAADLQRINNEAQAITISYERQLRPLQQQLALLQRPEWDRQRRINQLDIGIGQSQLATLQAGPSPAVQGEVAADRARLAAAEQLVNIENKRAQMAQDAIDAANRGKSALEQQAEAQKRIVQGLQEEHQAAQDARSVRIEGLREEASETATIRRERLDDLREETRAASETRSNVLDGIKEQQRARQEARRDEIDAIKDAHRQQLEAIADVNRADDEAHRTRMSHYQEQIDALRARLDADKQTGKTQTEQQLDQLNRQEQQRSQAQSLAEAVRNIREADTIKERLEAVRRLRDLQHEQEVARQRQALQDRIQAEQEAREERRAKIQEQINVLERQSREDDRRYQQQQEERRVAADAQQRAVAQQERELDRKAHDQEVADAKAVRDVEARNKEQDRLEAKQQRDEERAARDADKEAQAQIREQERQDRVAERAEEAAIRAAQAQEKATTEAAQAERDAQREQRERTADEIKARNAPIELERLRIEERVAANTNSAEVARQAGIQARLEAIKAIEVAEGNIYKFRQEFATSGLQQQIAELKISEQQRLDTIKEQKDVLDLQHNALQQQKLDIEAQTDALNIQIGRLQIRQQELKGESAGEAAPTGGASNNNNAVLGAARAVFPGIPVQGLATNIQAAINKEIDSAQVGDNIGANLVVGIVGGIRKAFEEDTESLPAAIGGLTYKLWDWIKSFWGISSPSKLMQDEWAPQVIQGAVLGIEAGGPALIGAVNQLFTNIAAEATNFLNGPDSIAQKIRDTFTAIPSDIAAVGPAISDAIKSPFAIDLSPMIGGLVEQIRTAWDQLPANLTANTDSILTSMKAPFEAFVNQYLPGLTGVFDGSGLNAVRAWINGWYRDSPAQAIANTFNNLITGFFQQLNQAFQNLGINAAVQWVTGWSNTFMQWWNSGWSRIINGLGLGGQQQQQQQGQQIQARHQGGPVSPGVMYKLQAGEGFMKFDQPGMVIDRGTMSRMGNIGGVSSSAGANVTVTVANGAVQVSTSGGVDEDALGQRIGAKISQAVVSAIDEAQRYSPAPVRDTLGGAQ